MIPCENCGKEFVARSDKSRFCSGTCSYQGTRGNGNGVSGRKRHESL